MNEQFSGEYLEVCFKKETSCLWSWINNMSLYLFKNPYFLETGTWFKLIFLVLWRGSSTLYLKLTILVFFWGSALFIITLRSHSFSRISFRNQLPFFSSSGTLTILSLFIHVSCLFFHFLCVLKKYDFLGTCIPIVCIALMSLTQPNFLLL